MSKDWALLRLGDFLSELPKSTLPASCAEGNGAYAFYCSSSEPKAADTWLQEQPAILMGTGGVASVHLGKGRYAYSTDTWAIRIKESAKLTQPYAYRVLELSLPKIDYAGFEGSGLRHLRKSYIKDFRFLAPSDSAPQKRIVSILDGIDTAIEKTEALITKYQQIKAGLMHDLFTRGVLPNGQLRPPRQQAPELYQETAIGWIPKEWAVAAIEKVLARIIDYRGKTPEKTVSGIPLITAKNVRMGYIDPEPREFIAESAYASWMTRGIPNKGDVLFTTEAPLGNVAQVPSDDRVAFAQRAIILQPSEVIEAAFLAYRLMTETAQNAISRLASGSTALGIKQSEFRKVCIAFPNAIAEQREIARRLHAIDILINAQRNAQNKLHNKKSGLMHDLLTGKVPVKVEEAEVVDG